MPLISICISEALDLVQLNRASSPPPIEVQPPSTVNYQSYENPDAYIANSYNYAKQELLYNPHGRARIWSLANTAADETTPLQLTNTLTNMNAMQREWTANYMPSSTYASTATKNQTAVVATISMQPTSPAHSNGPQRYGGPTAAVTPPQTPPNQLHAFAGAFNHGSGMHTANRDMSAYNAARSEELRTADGVYCKGQNCA